jgi:hypothetical protein
MKIGHILLLEEFLKVTLRDIKIKFDLKIVHISDVSGVWSLGCDVGVCTGQNLGFYLVWPDLVQAQIYCMYYPA